MGGEPIPAGIVGVNPRLDDECAECPTGKYEYCGQATDRRGEPASRYQCGDCGHEVMVA